MLKKSALLFIISFSFCLSALAETIYSSNPEYQAKVQNQIYSRWHQKIPGGLFDKDLKTIVHFSIDGNGNVNDVTLKKASTHELFNQICLDSVRESSPLPVDSAQMQYPIFFDFDFDYNVVQDASDSDNVITRITNNLALPFELLNSRHVPVITFTVLPNGMVKDMFVQNSDGAKPNHIQACTDAIMKSSPFSKRVKEEQFIFNCREGDSQQLSILDPTTKKSQKSLNKVLKKAINKNWHPPKNQGGKNEAVVRFNIQRDGRLTNLKILKSSGYNIYDTAAIKALEHSSPLQLKDLNAFQNRAYIVYDYHFSYDPNYSRKMNKWDYLQLGLDILD